MYTFECILCEYGNDYSNTALQIHIRTVHEKRRDFECTVCHREFSQSGQLKIHRESVHEGVRYECPVAECDEKYIRKHGCIRHIHRKHRSGVCESLVPIRTSTLPP
jgi:hypothetical protein